MADDKKPRNLNMGDMLKSPRPNPALNDALEIIKNQPPPEPRLSRREREEQERREEIDNLKRQLSEAESVEDLKPILEAIIDKLWS